MTSDRADNPPWRTRHLDGNPVRHQRRCTSTPPPARPCSDESRNARDDGKKFLAKLLPSRASTKNKIDQAAEGNGIAGKTYSAPKPHSAKRPPGKNGAWNRMKDSRAVPPMSPPGL
jgi:hypothetical protein